MKNRKLPQPSAALVVACLALIMSMAGTSYAAVKINGKNIKKGTISGKALKKNTLTGTQINESKLKRVPSATNAVHATSADLLAGLGAGDLARSANLVHVFRSMNAGDADITLASAGTISVKMSCKTVGPNDELSIYAATTADGALLNSENDSADPLNTTTPAIDSEISDGVSRPTGTAYARNGYDDTGFVISADSAHLITLLEGSSTKILNRAGKTCIYGGMLIVE